MTTKTQTINREDWIGLLGSADPADLESALEKLNHSIEFTHIVKPETGMLMVQAKADGSNSRFNLGEITVSKCILEINGQYMGAGWTMGSNLRHAELAALFDGLFQDPLLQETLNQTLIPLLKDKQLAKDERRLKDAADTKVEFFTLKRGE
ncbi:MAG: phosphonate C-P lyase system protein PhnG [Pseudomonadota bacterium]